MYGMNQKDQLSQVTALTGAFKEKFDTTLNIAGAYITENKRLTGETAQLADNSLQQARQAIDEAFEQLSNLLNSLEGKESTKSVVNVPDLDAIMDDILDNENN